jgi:hypothetical protein
MLYESNNSDVCSAAEARQLGDVGGDAPGLVAGEQVSRRASARLLLEINSVRACPFASRTMKQSWP